MIPSGSIFQGTERMFRQGAMFKAQAGIICHALPMMGGESCLSRPTV